VLGLRLIEGKSGGVGGGEGREGGRKVEVAFETKKTPPEVCGRGWLRTRNLVDDEEAEGSQLRPESKKEGKE